MYSRPMSKVDPNKEMYSPSKILIDGPAWIGDMVMAQALFKLLKQQYPNAQIDVLAPAWTKPLLDRMPEVTEALVLPFGHGELQLARRYQLGRSLRAKGYDWAILLRNSFKSGLIPYWARIKLRTGWLGEMRYPLLNDWRKLDKKRHPLMVQRFMALAYKENEALPRDYPFPQLVVSPTSINNTLQSLGLEKPTAPILALCPGAEFGPAKRWPEEYFAEVANEKIKDGWQVWLFGSKKDKPITDKINTLCDHSCVDLAGQTQLTEVIDLLALARVVVTNDSGLMHIAAALGRTIIVMYGSSSAKFTPPLTRNVKKLSLDLECSPCFKRECPLGHMKCLIDLPPSRVLQAITLTAPETLELETLQE